ncbi:MAG: phosphoglycerate dehydrogenase, partial [Candidatus Puniceispirillaceae bacterium]
MAKSIVLIAEDLSPAVVEALGPDFDIRYADGADRRELLAALPEVQAILIRSATHMDSEAIGVGKN